MNKIHYFTDTDLLLAQSSENAFGPVSPTDSDYLAGEDRFRVSSHHTATNNPLAYAISNGVILVQQDGGNPNVVNVLLKPSQQPDNDLPKIKYFIYRGILKNSLTDGTNVINGGNTLAKNIVDHNATTPQKVLGIDLTGANYSDTDPVDNAFYLPKPDFELWKVYGGWSIGTFDMNGFGFEIVFESDNNEINFKTLRESRHLIKTSTLGGSPSQVQVFENKTVKQEVLNFLDPAAFWGSMYNNTIFARLSTDQTSTELVHDFSKKKKDEIYRELIEGGTVGSPVDIYSNKNIVFLDIRNDFNDSFNYFEDYDDSLRISFIDDNNEPTTLFNYYGSGWPILALDTIPGGSNESPIRIAFPTTNNSDPLVEIIFGDRKYTLKERIKEGKSSFKRFQNYLQSGYTDDSLFLNSPNYDSGPSVSNYIKLKYLVPKLYDNSLIDNAIPFKKQYAFDYIFQPTILKQRFSTNDSLKINLYDTNSYINYLQQYGIDYSARVGIAEDQGNVILFWALAKRNTKKRFKASTPGYSITSSTDNSVDHFVSFIANRAFPDRIAPNPITVGGNPIQLLQEVEGSSSFFSKKNDLDYNSEFSALILGAADFSTILNVASTNFTTIHAPYLCISSKEEILDDNGSPITEIKFSLKGLADDGSGGVEISEIPTGITVYTPIL